MEQKLTRKHDSVIPMDERYTIDNVLKNYDFNVLSVERVRSAYKIHTDIGFFCLKKVSHGYRKAKKSFYISEHLKNNGFGNVVDYYRTKNNKLFLKIDDTVYYLTYWIEGREADFKVPYEVLRCSEMLAEFHNHAKGFKKTKSIKIRSYYDKWERIFERSIKEMHGFIAKIDGLDIKTEFDYSYKENIDYYIHEAKQAIEILKHSDYNRLRKYQKNQRYVCHDSYYYQNILIDNNNKLYIVDLESCCYNLPMSDLGKFIRRVLSKSKYKWDFDLCRKIIESYNKIRPLSKEEYYLLLAMLVFPHKFWKLGIKRYIKNKKWNEARYMKKLNKIIKYCNYKKEFIDCYVSFYNLQIS